MSWLVVVIRLLFVGLPQYHVGVATTFSAVGDEQNPVAYAACLHRDLRDATDMIIAHRDLPCNAKVLICLVRTNRCVVASVGDRGPFGKKRNGTYRAAMDLAPAVRRKLKHNGYEAVQWRSLTAEEGNTPWQNLQAMNAVRPN
jgi:hypothetical protein